MSYRCLLLDDEPLARELLSGYIQQLPSLSLVASCPDALAGLHVLHTEPVDLLFIDIKMPQLSGIDLIRALAKPPALILTTAFPEYALDGFEVGAVDYLLKPFSFTRFVKAVHRVLERTRPIEVRSPSVSPATSCLFLKVDRKIVKILLAEVLYWQAYGNYVKVFLRSGQSLLVSETLGHIEKLLPAQQFIRTHKSYIVSLGDITEYQASTLLIGSASLPIGDLYRKHFLDALG